MSSALSSVQTPVIAEGLPDSGHGLRIAVVTETYPPEVNGVALTLQRLVEGLRDKAHDIQLIRPRQSAADVAGTRAGLHEVLMRGMPIPTYPELKMGLPARRALLSLWRRWRPDVVHIATEGPLGWSALQAARQLGLPVCSDFRTNFQAYSRHYGISWLRRPITAYLRLFHNRSHSTMVPTERLRDELATLGFERLVVVRRGVDTGRFDPAHRSEALRREWGVPQGACVALFVGRLAPEKNLATLVSAVQAMRRANPAVRLVVVGDGPARRELQGALPDAVFAGKRFGEELAAHYASADLFVFPSLTETFGNVTVEAMASALPVMAYDHAAAGLYIRDGVNGRIARPGDEADFIDKAVGLVQDRVAATAMGLRARATAAELGWPAILSQVEGVLQDAIDSQARAGARAAAHPAMAQQL